VVGGRQSYLWLQINLTYYEIFILNNSFLKLAVDVTNSSASKINCEITLYNKLNGSITQLFVTIAYNLS